MRNYASMTYWEAVDDICRRTGNRIRPHYDMHTPGIVVSAGPPGNFPRAYAGPVRAQITGARRVFIEELNYEEAKGRADAQLPDQSAIHLGRSLSHRGLCHAARTGRGGDRRQDRAVAAAQAAGGGWNATSRGLRQVTASLKLNPVPVSARSLDVLQDQMGPDRGGRAGRRWSSPISTPAKLHCSGRRLRCRSRRSKSKPAARYIVSLNVVRDLVDARAAGNRVSGVRRRAGRRPGPALSAAEPDPPSLGERGVQLKIAVLGESAESEPAATQLHYPRLRARRDLELVFRNVPLPMSKPE